MLKELGRNTRRVPDEYDGPTIQSRIGQKYIVQENLKIELDDYREHVIMITRHLQQFNQKRLNIELKQSVANNQLEFYRDIYQNLTPHAE